MLVLIWKIDLCIVTLQHSLNVLKNLFTWTISLNMVLKYLNISKMLNKFIVQVYTGNRGVNMLDKSFCIIFGVITQHDLHRNICTMI